ncbi:MAG TPA: murein L,D-transpeptidase catalytic domain family protein [Longimicrobiales bacterium]|nr:murein L,D-transpeptidase catalytic domain family protein [Longimicrobiales bacterium]
MRQHLLPLALGVVLIGTGGALPLSPRVAAARTAADAAGASVAAAAVATPPVLGQPLAPTPVATTATATGARNDLVDDALSALRSRVGRLSHPEALRYAFQAYYNYRAAHPGQVRKPYLYFVDYGLSSSTPRGYVFNMATLKVVDGPFTVAHGRGSSGGSGVPTRFSNASGSGASSLGLYLAQETYAFSGHSAGRLYHSIGMRLRGLDDRYNDRARARGVVVHGAPYVTASRAGRSQGCPAMEQARARRLIPMLSNGSLVFLFSPRDAGFLRQAEWVNG